MKILLVNSLIFGSVLVWPMTASLHHGETSRSWLPISLTDQAPGSDYVTSPVKVDEVVKTIMATGTLIPAKNVDVGSVLSGQIRKLCVDFNDKVVRGQVLAELDERSFDIAVNAARAALENARAEVRGAEARLERAAISVQQATLQKAVLEARVDRARVALDVADRELKRKLWLQERNAAPLADVQDSQSRRDAAAASLRESKAVLANQAEVIDAARADLKKAKADIAGTRSNAEKAAAQLQSAHDVGEVGDRDDSGAGVGGAIPELPLAVGAPATNGSVLKQRARVGIASHHVAHGEEPTNEQRHVAVARAVPELTVGVQTPASHLPIGADGARVGATRGEGGGSGAEVDGHGRKPLERRRAFSQLADRVVAPTGHVPRGRASAGVVEASHDLRDVFQASRPHGAGPPRLGAIPDRAFGIAAPTKHLAGLAHHATVSTACGEPDRVVAPFGLAGPTAAIAARQAGRDGP